MNLDLRTLFRMTVVFFLTTITFAILAFYFRFGHSCPKPDQSTIKYQQQMIHSRDSVIEALKADKRVLVDSLEMSREIGAQLKKAYEINNYRIRNADTRVAIDSLWAAFKLPD